MLRILTTLIVLLITAPCLVHSQNNGKITGRITDNNKTQPLDGATISALNESSGIFIKHAVTNTKGEFTITGLPLHTKLEIIVSFTGYRDSSSVFTLKENKLLNTGNWKMNISAGDLEEVTVTARKSPFIVKKDTLEFNADAFKSLPTDMVQDLLRKLPGIVMDEQGNITVNGKKVNKIKIDGRDFFSGSLKMASENLPGAIIDKVQVYETRERGEQNTTIIQPGNKDVTLNLTLKKDSKKGIFGHVSGGYGTEDRYKAAGFLNRFDEGKRLSLYGGTGNMEGVQGMRGMMAGDMAMGSAESGGIIKSSTGGGINLNDDFGKKGRLDLGYMADINNRQNATITDRTNILPDSSFLYKGNSGAGTITRNHRINAGVIVELDTLQSISFTPAISYSENISDAFTNATSTTTEGKNINSQQNRNRNNDHALTLGNRFNYMRSSADKKTNLSLNWDINFRQGGGDQSNLSKNTFYNNNLITEDSLNQSGNLKNSGVSNNLSLNIYRQLSKKIISIMSYTFVQNKDNYDKDVFNYNTITNKHDLLDSTYSIHNKNTGITHLPTASIGYRGNKFSAEVGAGVRFIKQDNQIIWKDSTIRVEQQNFSPRANFSYRLNKNSQITAGYTVNANQPTPEQLAPVQDNTNPLYIKLGNPFLRSEIVHQFNTDLTYFTSDYKWYASLRGNGIINKNAMVENTYYDTLGKTISTFQNVDGTNQFDVNLGAGSTVRLSEWNFTFGLTSGIRSGTSIGFVNLQQNNSRTTQFNSQVHFSINYQSSFFVTTSAGIDMNKTRYSLNGIEDIDYNLKNMMVFARWMPVKRFAIKSSVLYFYNSQLPADFQRSRTLVNAALSYNFLKKERLTVDIGVNDLLNNNISVTRTVTPNAIEVKQINALRRYGMLTVNYRLSQFNGLN